MFLILICFCFIIRLFKQTFSHTVFNIVVDNKINTTGEIIEDYKMGIVIFKEGTSEFDFTPSNIIDSTKVKIKATGYIGCEII